MRLVTPAFLGGADQGSEWRTPPIKALLRQWWRIAFAPKVNFDEDELREAEGVLWGHAWLNYAHGGREPKTWALRSGVSVALMAIPNPLDISGRESSLRAGAPVIHPNVQPRPGMRPGPGDRGAEVGSLLYLGYGPLGTRGQTHPPALAASPTSPQKARLILSWKDSGDDEGVWLDQVLKLIHLFGCIGGRSRNGFGSIELLGDDNKPIANLDDASFLRSLSIDLERCLDLDWPHAIGADQKGPLVWTTKEAIATWQEAMKSIAELKIAFRTSLQPGTGGVAERHILAYPVTNHRVRAWGNQARLANQLRFKVHRVQGPQGKDRFVALAFHLPHRLPEALASRLSDPERKWVRAHELEIWRKVHAVLDEKMARLA